MRVIITVKCRGNKIAIEPKLDQSSKDNVREINAGKALYDSLNAMFSDIAKDQSDVQKKVTG